jgi:hypothetical protein
MKQISEWRTTVHIVFEYLPRRLLKKGGGALQRTPQPPFPLYFPAINGYLFHLIEDDVTVILGVPFIP